MRILSTLLAAAIIMAAAVPTASAGGMRCGNDIVSIGESAFTVSQKCGNPVSKIEVGYTINEEQKRELRIEDWVFGPINQFYYFVTMVGGRVSKIRSERQ